MPYIQRRGLGGIGIQHDPNDFDVDPLGFTGGSNIWFDGVDAKRAPVFRTVYTPPPSTFSPAFVTSLKAATGYDTLFMADTSGNLQSWLSGAVTTVTPTTGFTATPGTETYTSTQLGDVLYINRDTQQPFGLLPGAATFAPMPSWSSTWTCTSLRAYKDYLIALGVTKAGVAYPQMVKTSDLTLAGQFPDSWDQTDPTKVATENELTDLRSPLVDGAVLRESFILYTQREVWLMQAVVTPDVFEYRALFDDGGVINQNCIAEVDGFHYVFGSADIYTHDGNTKESLVFKKNRDYVFRTLKWTSTSKCFVRYQPKLRTIMFCYPSVDPSCAFTTVNGCNRALVVHLDAGTQFFIDLPDVTSATVANLNSVYTWATAPSSVTWASIGGSWADQSEGFNDQIVFSTRNNGAGVYDNLTGYDWMNTGTLAAPFDPNYNMHSVLERTGIDLDDQGASLNVTKLIRSLFPQIDMVSPIPIYVQIGTSMQPMGSIQWGTPSQFLPGTDYKVDCFASGRYLGVRFMTNNPTSPIPTPLPATQVADFSINGYDAEILPWGAQ